MEKQNHMFKNEIDPEKKKEKNKNRDNPNKENNEDDSGKYYPKPGEENIPGYNPNVPLPVRKEKGDEPMYSPDPDKEKEKGDYREFRKETDSLKNLYNKVFPTLPADSRITLTHESGKLELILDKKKGFEGYEDFSIRDYEDLFNFKYRGLINNALETFSDKSTYFSVINNSKVLSSFLKEIKNTELNQEGYTPLLLLNVDGDYNEAETALDFFLKSFKKKLSS